MIDKIIKNVLELHGVDGACIFDKKGNLLHNQLPDFFLDDFLDDLARRVKALYEAVDENYMPCEDYILKFPQKYICLRRSRNVLLLVAIDPSVNFVSLRMVTNLVLKHITPKVLSEMRATLASSSPPAEQPAPTESAESLAPVAVDVTPPPPATSPPVAVRGHKVVRPKPTRSFRGNRY